MESGYCLDCKMNTETVLDHGTGDTICSDCGLVLEARYIDEISEWRTFGDDGNDDKDPNRVGFAIDPLLMDAALSTQISKKPPGSSKSDIVNRKVYSRDQKPVQVLQRGFGAIVMMADRLGLTENSSITIRAREIYKTLQEQKTVRPKNLNAVYAACLFVACREDKKSRTLKEITRVSGSVSSKEINKIVNIIKKHQEVSLETMKLEELVRRHCSKLGMNNEAVKAVQEAVHKSEEIDIRRNPETILAAIIYIVSQLSGEKKPLIEISRAADVAENTIRNSCKDVYPHASRLIPSWYAREEDIRRICVLSM